MRKLIIGLSLVCGAMGLASPATAQLSVGISLPGVSIGINVPVYPSLVQVPGYPVYYAPHLRSNFFFYDGLYWVYEGDHWYSSGWYNGPWDRIGPQDVPLFVLRVPVRYYRAPPPYFRGWSAAAPPRWDRHWGPQWAQQHPGWDRWDRRSAPRPVPLPSYQRDYRGERYPHQVEQQRELRDARPQPAAPQPRQAAPRTPPGRDKADDKREGGKRDDDKRNDNRNDDDKRNDNKRNDNKHDGDNGRR